MNTLVKRDRKRRVANSMSKVMRRVVPFIFAGILSVLLVMTLCFAADSGDPPEGTTTFFDEAFTVLEILIVLIGGGLALWGIINLLEGYGNDNPGAKSQGIKQLMSGAGIILVGVLLVPLLKNVFSNNSGM